MSWMLTDAVPPPVSAPSAKSRAGQASSMYTFLGLSLGTTRLAVAPIQPNHAGCGNSLSNIKPATVLRLRRAPCSQTSAGSAAPTRVCSSPASPSYFSRLPSRNSFVLQGRDHVTVLLLSRQSINSCSLTERGSMRAFGRASAVARRLILFYHRPRRRIRNLRSPLSQIKTIKEPQLSLYCEGKRCIEFLPS